MFCDSLIRSFQWFPQAILIHYAYLKHHLIYLAIWTSDGLLFLQPWLVTELLSPTKAITSESTINETSYNPKCGMCCPQNPRSLTKCCASFLDIGSENYKNMSFIIKSISQHITDHWSPKDSIIVNGHWISAKFIWQPPIHNYLSYFGYLVLHLH